VSLKKARYSCSNFRHFNPRIGAHACANQTVPYGTALLGGADPGTSCQATIGLSLRDWGQIPLSGKTSSHGARGRKPTRNTSGDVWGSHARSYRTLRDGSLGERFPRHFVPGYDQAVPPGRKTFSRLRSGSTSLAMKRRGRGSVGTGASRLPADEDDKSYRWLKPWAQPTVEPPLRVVRPLPSKQRSISESGVEKSSVVYVYRENASLRFPRYFWCLL
jgi:hypothetical protein